MILGKLVEGHYNPCLATVIKLLKQICILAPPPLPSSPLPYHLAHPLKQARKEDNFLKESSSPSTSFPTLKKSSIWKRKMNVVRGNWDICMVNKMGEKLSTLGPNFDCFGCSPPFPYVWMDLKFVTQKMLYRFLLRKKQDYFLIY